MYKIERDPACYILTFSGLINADEMQRWHDASKTTLIGETAPSFGVIINMKDLQPIDSETKTIMVSGQKLYKEKGMKRSAVILNSQEVCKQFKSLALQSGIYATERYLDASEDENVVKKAIGWVKNATDPDL